ncbi:MAG: HAMP domain-containing histidine kinase [Hyphomonadaceae bacterium]|nr:HAMP domain-containing histidine kinase [Hyphomonadaceae bacterium]
MLERMRACEIDPKASQPLQIGPRRISFYNPVTLAPANAGDLQLPSGLRRLIRSDRQTALHLSWPFGYGTIAAVNQAATSPCGLIVVRINASPLERPRIQQLALAAGMLSAAVAAFGAYWLMARPLLRRVSFAASAAAKVGSAAFEPTQESGWDDLGEIHQVLRQADARIKSSEAMLRARAADIESMLGAIAHDLKTPLAVMQLNLHRAASAEMSSPAHASITTALREIQHAAALLENLETTAHLRQNELEPTFSRFDLCTIVAQTAARFSAFGEHQKIEVSAAWPDHPVLVQGDLVLASRLLVNIVHNSFRHSGGRNVALQLVRQERDFELTIRDDGKGFSESQLLDLQRPPPAIVISPGAGQSRGLTISRLLCEKMGLAIAFSNGLEGGAEVTIRGPVEDSAQDGLR